MFSSDTDGNQVRDEDRDPNKAFIPRQRRVQVQCDAYSDLPHERAIAAE